MIITKEYIKSVQPKINGKSDKYSWNIYRYLKRHKGEDIRVFKGLIIGCMSSNGIIGNTIKELMSSYTRQEYWFDGEWETLEEHGWFEKYQKIGRCLLIAHNHAWYEGEDTRFTYVNNTRRCNWCGQWQHKELRKVVKREIKEQWRDDKC